jgi:L-glyceraldehyde 3-phosphate reductase
VIAFSPLGQGMLTDRYLDGVPEDSRAAKGVFLDRSHLTEENLARVRALNEIAGRRGQTLAQMAVAWVLRDQRVTSALVGASSVNQLDDSLGALDNLDFSAEELGEIDRHAVEAGINIWAKSSDA